VLVDLDRFVGGRTEIVEARVQPLAVVEHLDEVEHRPADLSPGDPRLAVDQLAFEGREEALSDGIGSRRQLRPIVWVRSELSV
jgi:hypothetical protein